MAEFIPTGLAGLSTRPAATGIAGRPAAAPVRRAVPRAQDREEQEREYQRQELMPPPRPQQGLIPPQEAVEELVGRALAALSRGFYWDRGSIINLVL